MPSLSINHRQQEAPVGCLAACAQMALEHINVSVNQSRLNRLLGLTDMGVPWPQIERLSQLGVASIFRDWRRNPIAASH